MSTQRGNSNRSRPQKYKNQAVFKNNLYDKSNKTKFINSIEVSNVCERCKKIIEWKIKYKKYKPLKTPAKCIKCDQKMVKHAYHNICLPCATQHKVCAKCGDTDNIVEGKPSKEEAIKLDAELQSLLKGLSERKRRTFIRYMNNNGTNKKRNKDISKDENKEIAEEEKQEEADATSKAISKEDLLLKLKLLVVKDEDDDEFDDFDSDSDSFI